MRGSSLVLQRRAIPLVAAILIAVGGLTVPAAATAPSNDSFESATVIDALPFSIGVDTTEATRSSDDPKCDVFTLGHSVWYSFTPSKDMRIVATAPSHLLVAVTGTLGAWTPRGCDREQIGLRLNVVADETIYLMLGTSRGQPGAKGTLSLTQVQAPTNDDFDDATKIGGLPFHDTVDLDLATTGADKIHRASVGGRRSGTSLCLKTSTCSTSRSSFPTRDTFTTDITVSAYSGERGSLDRVGMQRGLGHRRDAWPDRIRDSDPNEPLYVMVGLHGGGLGLPVEVEMRAGDVPSNDRPRAATEIDSLPFEGLADTFWAGPDGDPASAPGCDESRHSVWYSFTPPTDLRLVVRAIGIDAEFGAGVARVYGGRVGSLRLLACSAPISGLEASRGDAGPVNLRAGQTVYLLADGGRPSGRVKFRVQAVPVDTAANDAYADATASISRSCPSMREHQRPPGHERTSRSRLPRCPRHCVVRVHAGVHDARRGLDRGELLRLGRVRPRGDRGRLTLHRVPGRRSTARIPTTASWRPAERLRFTAKADHTYRIVVGAVGEPSLLHLSISEHVLVRIDPTGRLTDAGAAVIHGTVRCSHRLDGVRTTSARQTVPPGAIRKGVSQDLVGCVSGEERFRTTVFPSAGVFHRGPVGIDMEWQFGERFVGDYAITARSAGVVLE